MDISADAQLTNLKHFSRQVAAKSPCTGYLEDSDRSETETELWTALIDGFHAISKKLLPVTATGNLKRRHLKLVSTLRDPSRLIEGTASAAHYRIALIGLLAHVRGIRDTLADHEYALLELLQIAHDPRVGRNRSFADGSGRRVALHRRRRRGIKVGKAPVTQCLPPRLVKLPERLTETTKTLTAPVRRARANAAG